MHKKTNQYIYREQKNKLMLRDVLERQKECSRQREEHVQKHKGQNNMEM